MSLKKDTMLIWGFLMNRLNETESDVFNCSLLPLYLNKRALWPWVAHLRMTDQWNRTICEILVECIIRNNSVKLYCLWVSGSGDVI